MRFQLQLKTGVRITSFNDYSSSVINSITSGVLQNRVDPQGNYIRTTARGLWMGNRGVIHKDREIVRVFKHKAWITCVLEFKGRSRSVMTPDRWTELFFMDEATAFAAGHRPCFECRKDDARKFKQCWLVGNPSYEYTLKTPIKFIDEILHRERIDHEFKKIIFQSKLSELPDGTFVVVNDSSYVFWKGSLHHWTPFGYQKSITLAGDTIVDVLTPHSFVNTFRAGYLPQVRI